ncbi:MAG: cadherin-like beta sandwich domain-containing protein [Bacilli bacterium]|nr:cadherin-like beta sandwich domain-containing protein [Bacilli bacterium]
MIKIIRLSLIALLTFTLLINKVNAASAYIGVKSSSSTIIVGRTFTTTVTISSSVALGSWEFSLNYNPSLLKLESGNVYVADYGNGTMKSVSYTYRFKALASGTTSIGVKSYAAYDWNEAKMTLSAGTSPVKLLTLSQLEATYSKNNYLKSLSVEGKELSPIFDKNTLNYTVELDSNIETIKIIAKTEDYRSDVDGTGTKEVNEGDNKFNIIVTAQNGSTKTYTLNAIVKDPNPIEVTTITGDTMTIVKRESLLTPPEGFGKNSIKINDIIVPSFYNQNNQMVLVGLKDIEGMIALYIYDNIDNKYSPYIELVFDKLRILPLELEENKDIFVNYIKTVEKINNIDFQVYKINKTSEFAILYGMDINTGEKDYYIYDLISNNVIRFNNEESQLLNKDIKENSKIINILTISNVVSLVLFIISISLYFIKKKIIKETEIINKKDKKRKKGKLDD